MHSLLMLLLIYNYKNIYRIFKNQLCIHCHFSIEYNIFNEHKILTFDVSVIFYTPMQNILLFNIYMLIIFFT